MPIRDEQVEVQEERFLDDIKFKVTDWVRKKGWDENQLAEALDLLPIGADLLLKKGQWDLETAVGVALKLGFDLQLSQQPLKETV